MSNDFDCFYSGKENMIGECHHSTPPSDGVWKIAPKHFKMLEDACAKYEALVHYARRRSNISNHPALRFESEICALHGKNADWQHGYNSGMLAALRLVRSLAMKEYESVDRIENDQDDDSFVDSKDEDGDESTLDEEEPVEDEVEDANSALNEHPFLDT